jgi:hypothetical protein
MALGVASVLSAPTISAEHHCHALNAYWESVIAKEPDDATRLMLYVARARTYDGDPYWGTTICHTVNLRFYRTKVERVRLKKNRFRKVRRKVCHSEFSWRCMEAASRKPANLLRWADAIRLAGEDLKGLYTPEEKFESARFYINRKDASEGGRKWFDQNTRPLGFVHPASRHGFYRWATAEEKSQKKKVVVKTIRKKDKRKRTHYARR